MIELFTADTPHGLRASLILEECGLDYKIKFIDLMKGEQHDPKFLTINPRGQIPVVVDTQEPDGPTLTLAQSSAIILHYAITQNVLWPEKPAEQASALQWLMQATSDMSSTASAVYTLRNLVPEHWQSTGEIFMDRVEAHFSYLEGRLSGAAYLAGPLSVADLALYPIVCWCRNMIEDLDSFAAIEDWAERMADRPAVKRAVASYEGAAGKQ